MDSENLSTGTDTCFLVPDEVGTQDHITPYNGNSINLLYKWYMHVYATYHLVPNQQNNPLI